ncbi:hypothetical protein JYT51_01965 [Candidatus Amoebophilus asiaticus]|nr:hypothetical protein [Candidatus Amoebophilus asiaticus]
MIRPIINKKHGIDSFERLAGDLKDDLVAKDECLDLSFNSNRGSDKSIQVSENIFLHYSKNKICGVALYRDET